jgi:hypothetical protein
MRSSLTLFGTAIPAASTAVAGLSVVPATVVDNSASTSRVARAIAAAEDLYGASSTRYTTVAAAWSAVSVS